MKSFIELSHYAVIKISGDLAKDFLQGQITCDMNSITSHRFSLAAYCNPQGRIWSIFRIWQSGDHYLLSLPAEIAQETVTDLKKFAQFSKVEVTLESDEASLALLASDIPTILGNNIPSNPLNCTHENHLNILCIESDRWLIIGNKENIISLRKELAKNKFDSLPSSMWDLLEIRAGIPTIWKSTIGKLLPHDLNLPELNAIGFEKGCYKGQEIIARMQYRAQRKKHMYKAHYRGKELPTPGDLIVDDAQKNVGEVVSAAEKIDGGYELLAVFSDAAIESKKALLLNTDELTDIALAI